MRVDTQVNPTLEHGVQTENKYAPTMTPSGLSMGTMRKRILALRALASGLSPVKKKRIPRIIKEELDSPGWTRAERLTTGRDAMA